MQHFQFWNRDILDKTIQLAKPRLESWNAMSHPDQIALKEYCDDIEARLALPPSASELFLHMEIDVEKREYLLKDHDLDNYLYPVVKKLGPYRFRRVSAIKRVGDGSFLQIGQTKPRSASPGKGGWTVFSYDTGSISAGTKEWKESIRSALQDKMKDGPLKPGAVEVQIIWKGSSERTWTNLWKPTIDAMGPVLGEPNPRKPSSPNDGRIVSLTLHSNVDDSIEWSVQIGMLWRPAPNSPG